MITSKERQLLRYISYFHFYVDRTVRQAWHATMHEIETNTRLIKIQLTHANQED